MSNINFEEVSLLLGVVKGCVEHANLPGINAAAMGRLKEINDELTEEQRKKAEAEKAERDRQRAIIEKENQERATVEAQEQAEARQVAREARASPTVTPAQNPPIYPQQRVYPTPNPTPTSTDPQVGGPAIRGEVDRRL